MEMLVRCKSLDAATTKQNNSYDQILIIIYTHRYSTNPCIHLYVQAKLCSCNGRLILESMLFEKKRVTGS